MPDESLKLIRLCTFISCAPYPIMNNVNCKKRVEDIMFVQLHHTWWYKVQSVKSPKNANCDTNVLNLQNKIKGRLVNLSHYVGLIVILSDDDSIFCLSSSGI